MSFKAACVQINAARDAAPNIEAAAKWARAARAEGAELILFPENASMMEPDHKRLLEKAVTQDEDAALKAFRQLALETGAWILIGSLPIRLAGDKVANRSFLVNAQGEIAAYYDKIHMFDVDFGGGEAYRESEEREPGSRAVIADAPWGKLGMSICYDVRFPHLYRALAKGGARFLTVPAAFTRSSGEAHWHVLLRARAIENGCFVFAPAQCGEHAQGRRTFGHSLIVDPWGTVLADGGDGAGFVIAEIDPSLADEARRKIPSLTHDRPFRLEEA